MKIATWNVNSIRSRMQSVIPWIKENKVDILLLQEIKCQDEQFPTLEFDDLGYNYEIFGQKALNGVAILSKYPIIKSHKELPLYGFNDIYMESRFIEVEIEVNNKTIRLFSIYFPNGNPQASWTGEHLESPRFFYKLDFYDRVLQYLEESVAKNPDDIFIVGGDYNVMHKDIDVHKPEIWKNEIAFTEIERSKLDRLEKLGFVDSFREKNQLSKEFSWWNYRFGGFQKNHGLRIDYIFINKSSQDIINKAYIDNSTRSYEKPSDHVPCVVEMEI
jgi:exodeoxyribonuclease III